jgi:site-specific DNA recombinase
MKTKNRHGTVYPYFFCLGKQEHRTDCRQSVVRIEFVEEQVERLYERIRLSEAEAVALRAFVVESLDAQRSELESLQAVERRRLESLKGQQQRLLQAHYADAVPLKLFKDEQERITRESKAAEAVLAEGHQEREQVIEHLDGLLVLLTDCADLYKRAPDRVRRMMNQVFFTKVLVGSDDELEWSLYDDLAVLLEPELRAAAASYHEGLTAAGSTVEGRTEEPPAPQAAEGSRNDWMVGEGGLEPPRPCGHWHLKPARLPIPPLARGAGRAA